MTASISDSAATEQHVPEVSCLKSNSICFLFFTVKNKKTNKNKTLRNLFCFGRGFCWCLYFILKGWWDMLWFHYKIIITAPSEASILNARPDVFVGIIFLFAYLFILSIFYLLNGCQSSRVAMATASASDYCFRPRRP